MRARAAGMAAIVLLFAVMLPTPPGGQAQDIPSCGKVVCPAGAAVQTTADPSENDYYFACQTAAQSAYVNFAEAAISTSAMAFKPLIMSPMTGDPVLEGKAQTHLNELRNTSGAKTLQEAMSHCTKKTQPERVTVLQNPSGSGQFFVRDASGAQAWMPKSYAEPAKGKSAQAPTVMHRPPW